ncbi:hypothetical protein ERO13_A10G118840v2 [Gossypium hirsutum]|uniref:Uncharacterized protein n=1 Tax=Gossypium darwinii TaxID=34276 RepID=A0A5D2F0I9_GOSDA|nr:hypothetical protein ERO13_A10G118840v2 [Gossypium hirsutum]TYG98759.1 hypothetical protein ES288_A10G141900v1 [Gossypium darwinii]
MQSDMKTPFLICRYGLSATCGSLSMHLLRSPPFEALCPDPSGLLRGRPPPQLQMSKICDCSAIEVNLQELARRRCPMGWHSD